MKEWNHMNIGQIGLGIMGGPMAENLLKAGFALKGFDIHPAARQRVTEAGGEAVDAAGKAAENSDIIITMLPTTAILDEVIINDILPVVKKGAVVIDMSSVSPVDSKRWAEKLQEKEAAFLDAPVSGGEPKAIDGTLSIMAGGDDHSFAAAYPVLRAVGTDVTHVGEVGAGSTTKLANQILVNVTMAAMSEAVLLASKAGADIDKVYEAIRNGLAGSSVLDAKIPKILERDFTAGGRIDINLKDLSNVLQTGKSLGVPLPLASDVAEMYESMVAHGKKSDDHSGVLQHYEMLANYSVPKGGKHG
ncbi:NAD(P)-binding domain-containing protein [Marinococcus luteus]